VGALRSESRKESNEDWLELSGMPNRGGSKLDLSLRSDWCLLLPMEDVPSSENVARRGGPGAAVVRDEVGDGGGGGVDGGVTITINIWVLGRVLRVPYEADFVEFVLSVLGEFTFALALALSVDPPTEFAFVEGHSTITMAIFPLDKRLILIVPFHGGGTPDEAECIEAFFSVPQ